MREDAAHPSACVRACVRVKQEREKQRMGVWRKQGPRNDYMMVAVVVLVV
jgi:hypothetical protein